MVPSSGPIIAADQVSKSFGPNEVLRRVSLPVAEKDMVCVIGPSGSGKTTLLRCLALLEQPSTGRVTMRGTTVASAKPDSAERRAARAVDRRAPTGRLQPGEGCGKNASVFGQ